MFLLRLCMLRRWIALLPSILPALLIAGAWGLAPACANAQVLVRHALVIGNDNYLSSKLVNAASDARLVAQALQDVGFKVTRLENASQEQMLRALLNLQTDLEKTKGVGLFYFAGHGVQVRGENFLIPVNVAMRREEDVRSRGINAQEIIDRMSAAKNKLNMIFLDACRDDPFARGRRSSGAGLARLDAALGMLIAYSTSPGALAEDGEGSRNGPFAKHLANTLQQPGLKVEDVLKRVRTAVREETGGKQITWDNSAIEGDFYFSSGASAATSATPPATLLAANTSRTNDPMPQSASTARSQDPAKPTTPTVATTPSSPTAPVSVAVAPQAVSATPQPANTMPAPVISTPQPVTLARGIEPQPRASTFFGSRNNVPLQVSVASVQRIDGAAMEVRFLARLRVQNPNDGPVAYTGAAAELFLASGASIGVGVINDAGTVPRYGDVFVDVPITVSGLGEVRKATGLYGADRKTDVTVKGRLQGNGYDNLNFQWRGELALLQK